MRLQGYANPTCMGNRWCVKSVEWAKEFQEGPSCSKPPPHSSSSAPEFHLFSFIYYLLSVDSVSGVHEAPVTDLCLGLMLSRYSLLKSRFNPGCLGMNWFMRPLIIYRLSLKFRSPKVPPDLLQVHPALKGWSQDSQPGGLAPYLRILNEGFPTMASFWEDTHLLPFPKCVWNCPLGIWVGIEGLRI